MCDVCSDMLVLLDCYEDRTQNGGFHMNKKEILSFVVYVHNWSQRQQCMCCFKDLKNFEKLNNMVQIILSVAIRVMQTLPDDIRKQNEKDEGDREEKIETKEADSVKDQKSDEKKKGDNKDNKEKDEASTQEKKESETEDVDMEDESDEDPEKWTVDEKERLLQFITKVFLLNFPTYLAYKHIVHSSLEELSQQETSALNNYCEISDLDVPLFLLRNVCFFCDSNGIGALRQCFEKATPDTLPFNFAHLLITLIANLRLWMNIPAVMQCIVPLRTAVIRYMCKLSDKDLRMAGNRNMTDLMWAAVKEPLETHFTFDKEGLDLAFKYFTCSTLTIRLAGISQINNQITLYNESCNNQTLVDVERVANNLAQWFIENKIIEHIFGPNVHVEIIKQSQIILNFLAVEDKITNEQIDCIWATSQLKHCSKQVYDILIPLIKNLEPQPVQYLLKLVSGLDPTAHTESTLYLASALIKCIWNTRAPPHSHSHAAAIHQQNSQQLQNSYTALEQEEEEMEQGAQRLHKHGDSSSESIQVSDGESDKAEPKQVSKAGSVELSPDTVKVQNMRRARRHHAQHLHHAHHQLHPHARRNRQHNNANHPRIRHSAGHLVHHESDDSEMSDDSGMMEEGHAKNCNCSELHASQGSESDVDCSESSEEEILLEEGEIINPERMRKLKLRPDQIKKLKAKLIQQQKRAGKFQPPHEISSSEEEAEEEEEMDSEDIDSDEDLLRQVKLVHMKHSCRRESEESSDLDEEEAKLQLMHRAHMMLRNQNRQHFQGHLPHKHIRKNTSEGVESQESGSEEDGEKERDSSKQDSKREDVAGPSTSRSCCDHDHKTHHASGKGSPHGEETEIFDCTSYVQRAHGRKHKHSCQHGEYIEDILSLDEGSCHSSRISTKSEKNMADFDGEDLLSEEDELANINRAHYHHNHHHHTAHQMQQHLSSMASMYHTHMPSTVIHHRPTSKEAEIPSCIDSIFDDVCQIGNTLLWDLVQEDTIHLLPEGLGVEAEKALYTLVCFSTDKKIKMKFIEACIENLAHHRSVVVSLRLLPKVLSSFQQYRSGVDTHTVAMWAEKELNMMAHFFIDLVHYTELFREGKKSGDLYSHKEEVQVRLLFLTCVFSSMGSPDCFRLNLEQVDSLWSCLAMDTECSDECLSWFLNQEKSKEHHAMGLETFKHLFLEKMPQLKPELMSMIGLNLFQQLSHLPRLANASFEDPLVDDQGCGMDQLWSIALRAHNTDVSMTAIQFLNNYYINYGNGQLEKEDEFVKRCMDSLVAASQALEEDPETNLLVIQRGLVLLKNHLEAFRKRYAFHLRNWALDNKGITSHQQNAHEKQSSPIRLLLQPAGMAEKTQLEVASTDLVAELRAEVARWWEGLQKQQVQRQQMEGSHSSAMLAPILGAMLGDGPIRMITLGQEMTVDMDEKTLGELQFKDMQLVFVSVGASRTPRKMDGTLPSSCLPAPTPDKLPMMLLLEEPHFSHLLTLLEQLSRSIFVSIAMDSQEMWGLQTKARMLSRRVWELLMLLPSNPTILDSFKKIVVEQIPEEPREWNELLDAHHPHRLMYSLQIVEVLSYVPKPKKKTMSRLGGGDSCLRPSESSQSQEGEEQPESVWTKKFVSEGGLSHLLEVFKSGILQAKEEETWSQWNQECLAYLLRMISQFAVEVSDADVGRDDTFESFESPRKRLKRKGNEKIIIPRLNPSTLAVLDLKSVLKILMQILFDAAIPGDTNQVNPGTWGRAEVVHYSLSFLVSLAYSCDEVQSIMCLSPNFQSWLKRLTLEAPEPNVRREICMGLYRLCLGRTADSQNGSAFLLPILSHLLSFLDSALLIKPKRNTEIEGAKEKEPFGPGCRDYFWLVCRFVESISKEDATNSDSPVQLTVLASTVADHITQREYLETRHGYEEDGGMIGLLNLSTAIMKHNPPFKSSAKGMEFIDEVFRNLSALPTPEKRYLPKCKSQASRSAAYDLLVEMVKGNVENFKCLHCKMMLQHSKDSHTAYPWDYWPHEDGRAKCGYVGLTNLGATCYMATCMQHLYMLPQARQSVLQANLKNCSQTTYATLKELQRMFAYLQESERKAYNPRSFCKAYTMDKQPLNTGEQKDMTEFFTDLITKLEEMSPEMKKLIKNQFGGILTNNVVSLDCPHVSRTLEEFYTIRCQVTDMKNLYESLDEVTVKDMLEGDNMYTCSKCQKKVRAEKRACFKKLPMILCFNTMRYTFNMVTMMKEKVNTHFSFPLRLEMSQYMEKNLMGPDKLRDDDNDIEDFENEDDSESYEYELIGVTVHTGTADGGHYYSFIRDRLSRTESGQDKWFLFNDAEVKPFDPSQIASECFGGEMTSKTYDSVTDKFMDFSFEKTNSAYMLFYERCNKDKEEISKTVEPTEIPEKRFNFELSKELQEWIWQDNMQFLQDKNIIEHTYFGFMWQICGYIPTTLSRDSASLVPLLVAQLSTSFVLETLIHAKEKPTMLQWIEFLTKQFNSCQSACEWFLDHMAESDWWPQQILIKCPNETVRQLFQRLVIHVITQLRPVHIHLYLTPVVESEDGEIDVEELGSKSCVTRFVKKMLAIIEHGVRPHSKYLSEYFAFLLEFAKMGEKECIFLIHVNAISTMIAFYMGQKVHDNYVEILSDEEDEEEVITLTEDSYKPTSLEKMITLIAMLVEKSRGEDHQLNLNEKDYNSISGGKNFPFLFNQIRDNININQTCYLVTALTRRNENLAVAIVQMVFGAIKRLNPEQSQHFFKLLSLLVEIVGGSSGMPPFFTYVLQRFWELAKVCPQQCLEWMATQVTRIKLASGWVLSQMELWVETYLIAQNNVRVRNAAAGLLVALVPSNHFRQAFRTARSVYSPQKDITMSTDAIVVLHQIYEHLLSLLTRARLYVDSGSHGTSKLMCYFAVMSYCLISKTEKLMFSQYFTDLWQLFHPKLLEPQISMHQNKQALLMFWYHVCQDCPENIKLIVTNPHVCKNVAFNYILADHDDQEVVLFNRTMLPAYYGLLRMCCQCSRPFTRQLAQHQNIQWAFKNITPYPAQYTLAVEELFKIMQLMSTKYQDSTEEDIKSVNAFKRNTILLYLQNLDARSGWQTLISAFKILIDSPEDRQLLIYQQGLQMLSEAFFTLHVMYHEATACHVTNDIVDLLSILHSVLKVGRQLVEKKGMTSADVKTCLKNLKERVELIKKLPTLLNSYTPPEIRSICFEVLREMTLVYQGECIHVIVPILTQAHMAFQDSNMPVAMGPYFPKRGQKPIGPKSNIRPPRPQFQMLLSSNQIEASKGVDEAYDKALIDFFSPYHLFVDLLCRVAVNQQMLNQMLINLSALVAYEGVPLHDRYFAKLWYEIYHSEQVDKNCIQILCNCHFFVEYVDAVLLDERTSLNDRVIYQFFCNFFPKVHQRVLSDQSASPLDSLVASVTADKSALENIHTERELHSICGRINGDVLAMQLIFSVQPPKQTNQLLMDSLQYILQVCRQHQKQRIDATKVKVGERDTEPKTAETSGATPSKKRRISTKDDAVVPSLEEDKEEDGKEDKTSKSTKERCDNKPSQSDSNDKDIEVSDEKVEDNENISKSKDENEEKEKECAENSTSNMEVEASVNVPSTSKAEVGDSAACKSSKEESPQSSSTSMPWQHIPRERQTVVDTVAKQIETLFTLLGKK
ncbi:hypothetical protein ScPMuIL_013914 [Solemya velum]